MLYCRIVIINDGVPSVSNLLFLSSYKATCLAVPSHYLILIIIWPERKFQSMEAAKLYCFYVTPAHPLGSVQFSHSVVSDSLWPHESQHARPPCPAPTPGVHSDSRPSSQWCHLAISSSVVPFSSCPQSFPASESFPVSQPFSWGGQSTGVSALASVLPKKLGLNKEPLFLYPNSELTEK